MFGLRLALAAAVLLPLGGCSSWVPKQTSESFLGFITPYRIDIVQPVYFVIESFAQLAASLDADVGAMIDEAKRMGDLPARFEKAA